MKNHPPTGFITLCSSWLAATTLALSNAHAATYLWNVASPGPNNWNVNANWTPSTGNPGIADTAIFSDFGAGFDQFTVNNVVSANTTIASLRYTNVTTTSWNVTQIPSGSTLTVTGIVTVGGLTGTNFVSSAAMTGEGTFLVTGSSNLFTLGNTLGSGNSLPGTLDLSGLTTFIYSSTNGFIGVGDIGTANQSRGSGNLTLASGSNSITAATIDMNGATGTASTPSFNLGGGTNVINVNTFNVGGGRSTTRLQFSSFTGGLRLRGTGGTDTNRTTMVVGNRNTGGTGTFVTSGTVALDFHPVDVKLATLTLGLMSRTQSGSDAGKYTPSGIFSFDQGIVDATTINMGVVTGLSTNASATGSLTVGSTATLIASNISLANMSIDPTNNSWANGTLTTIYGAVVNVSNSIYKTSSINSTGTVVAAGTTLTVGGTIGSPTNALDDLNLSDCTLTIRADLSPTVNATIFETYGSTNLFHISSMPPIFSYPAQFPLIKYTGTIGGFGFDNNIGLGRLPVVSPPYVGYLSNNSANASVDLVIVDGPPPSRALTWDGTPTGDWDTTTTDWRFTGSSTFYRQNDSVLFDDTAAGITTVNLTTTLLPLSLTVSNATKNYTFTGTGGLSGAPGLVKQGAATLTIANSGVNDFGGGISVNGGKLQIGGGPDRLPTNAVVTLTDDATVSLDLNNLNQTVSSVAGGGSSGGNVTLGTGTLTVNGGGSYSGVISGAGGFVKGGSGTYTLLNANTYTGGTLVTNGTLVVVNTTGSGTGPGTVVITNGTLQLGTNSTYGSIAPQASGYITNGGTLRFNRSDNLTPAEVITGGGSVRHSGSGLLVFNHDNTYTNTTTIDRNNGILRISTPNALGTVDGGTTVTGGNGAPVTAGGALELSGGITFAPERLTLGCRGNNVIDWVGPSPFVNHDGTNTWTGPIDITTGGSYIALQSDSGLMRITGSLSGGPTATGLRMAVLRGAAFGEISGVISNGPVTTVFSLAVGDSGTWTLSGNNLYNGLTLVTNTATLLVNGSIGGTNVIAVGGTLGGTGTINAPVTIQAAGTLAPGAGSVGTLTINSNLTFFGNLLFELNKSLGANDYVAVSGALTNGGTGTLTVVNRGPGLAAGEKYTLFSQPVLNGAALTVTSADGVVWSNKLDVDGSIQVVSAPVTVPTTPTNLTWGISGNVLTLSWPASYLGWSLQAQTNSLSSGLSGTWYDIPGSQTVTTTNLPINPLNPTVFYRLKYTY